MIVVIPAYQPDDRLVDLVNELREKTAYPILVVDDGSSSDRAPVFEAVGRICTVLRHPLHMGRGGRSRPRCLTRSPPIRRSRGSWSRMPADPSTFPISLR